MRALDEAVASGKVLHLGLSDTPAWVAAQAATLAHCQGQSPPAVLQARYSLLSRDAERDLIPAAEELGMIVAAWSPLGGGALPGKYTLPGDTCDGSRPSAASVPEHEQAIARRPGGRRRDRSQRISGRAGLDDDPLPDRAPDPGRPSARPAPGQSASADRAAAP